MMIKKIMLLITAKNVSINDHDTVATYANTMNIIIISINIVTRKVTILFMIKVSMI